MEGNNRRTFLKTLASVGTVAAVAGSTKAGAVDKILSKDRMGVLVDTTLCIGCRNCEWACKEAHGMPTEPKEAYHDRTVFAEYRRPTTGAYTVINEFENPDNELLPINVKENCRHCNYPSCASACIVGAFTKNDNGAVTWDTSKCIGCRYCMVACPFQIPTFEYDKALQPNISKCDFCFDRTKEGKLPACVEVCPVEAMIYGPINEIISIAQKRIDRNPEKYVNHIYGLEEVGGTSWIYLSSIDFSQLKFIDHGKRPAPGTVESIQHGIFAYFVPPIALYAWLGGIMWMSKRKRDLELKNNEENNEQNNNKEEK
jgi:formate dehydrogenase iron-sulfur subunit